jgi:2-methylfumaryl-CoA hydratase
VIGFKENSNGAFGVIWVRTTGRNQHSAPVLTYVRRGMVRKRGQGNAPDAVVPILARTIAANDLIVPDRLGFTRYDFVLAGEPHRWGDHGLGEVIDHEDGVTVEEAEHMIATRFWQNKVKVHFDTSAREDGKRLI